VEVKFALAFKVSQTHKFLEEKSSIVAQHFLSKVVRSGLVWNKFLID